MLELDIQWRGLEELSARFEQMPDLLHRALARELEYLTLLAQSKVVREKLQGQVLHHRSGNLQRNIVQGVEEKQGGELVGFFGVGRGAPYGKVHEYGGTYNIPAHNRTSKLGRVSPVQAHTATYPERSFLRSVLREMEPTIRDRLALAAGRALRGES
jgi:phage gpG-like protein